MKPVVDGLRQEYEGFVEFRVYNFDRDPDANQAAAPFGVQYVPTFVFVSSSGEVVDQRIGAVDEAEMRSLLDSLS
jgi:thioredoxin-like negative regulator of GroEL